MFVKVKLWGRKLLVKAVPLLLLIAQTEGGIDVSGLTNVMTTLIYAILPLIVVVLIFKIFGNIIKGLSDMF